MPKVGILFASPSLAVLWYLSWVITCNITTRQEKQNLDQWYVKRSAKQAKKKKEGSDSVQDKRSYTYRKVQKANKNLDYTTIANRLRPASWSNDSHQPSVVKPVYKTNEVTHEGTKIQCHK